MKLTSEGNSIFRISTDTGEVLVTFSGSMSLVAARLFLQDHGFTDEMINDEYNKIFVGNPTS